MKTLFCEFIKQRSVGEDKFLLKLYEVVKTIQATEPFSIGLVGRTPFY